jgi:hypothetical protein
MVGFIHSAVKGLKTEQDWFMVYDSMDECLLKQRIMEVENKWNIKSLLKKPRWWILSEGIFTEFLSIY